MVHYVRAVRSLYWMKDDLWSFVWRRWGFCQKKWKCTMDPRIRGPVRLKRSLTILMTRLRSFELNCCITLNGHCKTRFCTLSGHCQRHTRPIESQTRIAPAKSQEQPLPSLQAILSPTWSEAHINCIYPSDLVGDGFSEHVKWKKQWGASDLFMTSTLGKFTTLAGNIAFFSPT